jgi:hypothetical protein
MACSVRSVAALALLCAVGLAGRGRCAELGELAPERTAAFMLWSDPWLEIGVGYRGGLVRQSLICADDPTHYAAASCVGADGELARSGLGSQPGGVVGRLVVYPARTVGVGADLSVDLPHPTDFEHASLAVGGEAASGPGWDLLVGPVLRVHSPVERMAKALRLRVSPGLYLRHGRIRPMAGNAAMASADVLDSGTYGFTLAGGGMSLELEAELARAATFRGVLLGGVAFPAEPPTLTTVEAAADEFAGDFETVRLGGGGVGVQLGVAFVAPRAVVAVEPSVQVRWTRTVLAIDDTPVGPPWVEGDGIELRTYSTQQDVLAVLGQITIRSAILPRR